MPGRRSIGRVHPPASGAVPAVVRALADLPLAPTLDRAERRPGPLTVPARMLRAARSAPAKPWATLEPNPLGSNPRTTRIAPLVSGRDVSPRWFDWPKRTLAPRSSRQAVD